MDQALWGLIGVLVGGALTFFGEEFRTGDDWHAQG